jgi:hypothetical protein
MRDSGNRGMSRGYGVRWSGRGRSGVIVSMIILVITPICLAIATQIIGRDIIGNRNRKTMVAWAVIGCGGCIMIIITVVR